MPLLTAVDLSVSFSPHTALALSHINLNIGVGEWLGVVGESGAGKSVLARALLGLLEENARRSGRIAFSGQSLSEAEHAALRGRGIGAVFQDAEAALNPSMTALEHVAEAVRIGVKADVTAEASSATSSSGVESSSRSPVSARVRAGRWLTHLGLEAPFGPYPHQLSGGMQQRVCLAAATVISPQLLIVDEPTSALDSVSAKQIITLFTELRHSEKMACVFISHDIPALCGLVDTLAVMRAGEIIEMGPPQKLCAKPAQPYTKALLRAAGV